jgi:hypothetical protein
MWSVAVTILVLTIFQYMAQLDSCGFSMHDGIAVVECSAVEGRMGIWVWAQSTMSGFLMVDPWRNKVK